MDIGSAVGRKLGVSDDQVAALRDWRASTLFSPDERLVLEAADAMTATPAIVSDDLFARLRARFGEPQLVELAATVAWENYRARFNRMFDVEAEGYSEGAVCALPARAA